jgi:hypothetical protein
LPAVKLLLRCDYTELLDATRTPLDLLTRLVGGSLRLTSAAARRLLDQRGVELRTIIVDHGQVLGVGRASRVPPGWLRDATLAVHSTCTGPLCDRPALGADLDHAQPWQPTHPDQLPGGTDVDNLGPLCAATNRAKETRRLARTPAPRRPPDLDPPPHRPADHQPPHHLATTPHRPTLTTAPSCDPTAPPDRTRPGTPHRARGGGIGDSGPSSSPQAP